MDEFTLVLLWDDVIEDIITYILSAMRESRGTLIEEMMLYPLIALFESSIDELMKLFTFFPEVAYLQHVMAFVFRFLYIGSMMILVLSSIVLLLKWAYYYWLNTEQKVHLLLPFQKLFVLQALHVLILPTILWSFEHYPKIIQWLNSIFVINLKKVTSEFFLLTIKSETIFLHTFCMGVITLSLIYIYMEYLMQGFKLLSFLVSSYLRIVFTNKIGMMLEPLKRVGIEMFCVFIIQRLLLMYLFTSSEKSQSIAELFYYATCLLFIALFPKIILKGVGENETM